MKINVCYLQLYELLIHLGKRNGFIHSFFSFFMTASRSQNSSVFAVIYNLSSDSVFQCLLQLFFSLRLLSEPDGNLAATAGIILLFGQTYALIESPSPPLSSRPRSLAPSRYSNALGTYTPTPTQARWRRKKRGAAIAMNKWR